MQGVVLRERSNAESSTDLKGNAAESHVELPCFSLSAAAAACRAGSSCSGDMPQQRHRPLHLLTISKRYHQPVDILGVGGARVGSSAGLERIGNNRRRKSGVYLATTHLARRVKGRQRGG